jgi:hypothetical protein
MNEERRYKIFMVDYHAVLYCCFMGTQDVCECFHIGGRPRVPEGARIVSVHENYSRRCFDFTLYHESFDVVPDGQMIPLALESLWGVDVVVAVREKDGRYRIEDLRGVMPHQVHEKSWDEVATGLTLDDLSAIRILKEEREKGRPGYLTIHWSTESDLVNVHSVVCDLSEVDIAAVKLAMEHSRQNVVLTPGLPQDDTESLLKRFIAKESRDDLRAVAADLLTRVRTIKAEAAP